MPGSVMRCASIVLNDDGRFWVLCGWEFGEYMWDSLLDAGVTLGIAPVSSGVALGTEVTRLKIVVAGDGEASPSSTCVLGSHDTRPVEAAP